MISKDNTTLTFVIPKELKERLEEKAKQEDRSMGNLIVKLLKDYLNNTISKK